MKFFKRTERAHAEPNIKAFKEPILHKTYVLSEDAQPGWVLIERFLESMNREQCNIVMWTLQIGDHGKNYLLDNRIDEKAISAAASTFFRDFIWKSRRREHIGLFKVSYERCIASLIAAYTLDNERIILDNREFSFMGVVEWPDDANPLESERVVLFSHDADVLFVLEQAEIP